METLRVSASDWEWWDGDGLPWETDWEPSDVWEACDWSDWREW